MGMSSRPALRKSLTAALFAALVNLAIPAAHAQNVGAIDAALDRLDRDNSDKDLLYYFERGELLRTKGAWEDSRSTWLKADETVRLWEEDVKINGSKILGDIGSYFINDSTRRYEGRDYEKVMLSVRIALDHLALGEWDKARTEIKKMHEREAVIAEFRSKEMEAAKKESEAKGIKTTSFKELNGYPIETLEDPAVRSLKNSYESAFANYLAGFVYESLGEPSLASAGYRKANEMRPGEKMLEDSLAGLDSRRNRNPAVVETLFVVESGRPPEITSKTIPILLPIISRGGLSMVSTPISWPVVNPVDTSSVPATIGVDDKQIPLSLLTNMDLMARRALSDEMPGIIFRSSVRAITKGVAQKAVQDNAGSLGLFGAVLSAAATAVAVATEKADTRNWSQIPGFYSVGRLSLPAGIHKITVPTPGGPQSYDVKISGPYAVVALRTSAAGVTLAQTPYVEPTPMAVAAQAQSVIQAKAAEAAKPAPTKVAKKDKKD